MTKWNTIPLYSRLRDAAEISELATNQSEQLLGDVATFIRCDRPSDRWWWRSASKDAFVISYDDKGVVFGNFWNELFDQNSAVYMSVTDSFTPPWPVFRGRLGTCLTCVLDSPHAEFFIFDKELSWLVFDTHHNSLHAFGVLKR